jgi:hypothetical protein
MVSSPLSMLSSSAADLDLILLLNCSNIGVRVL